MRSTYNPPPPKPHIDEELLNYLDHTFRDQCIQRGESAEEAHRRAGARDVYSHLLTLYRNQEDEMLGDN